MKNISTANDITRSIVEKLYSCSTLGITTDNTQEGSYFRMATKTPSPMLYLYVIMYLLHIDTL